MMKHKNDEKPVIKIEKIKNYLLNLSHPDGINKAKFFLSFGFSLSKYKELEKALLNHFIKNEVKEIKETIFGKKYIIDGLLQTPDNRNPIIRSIWFVEHHKKTANLITAYPLK